MFLRAFDPSGGSAVRQRAEDEFCASQGRVICSNEADFPATNTQTFPTLGVRGRELQMVVWVSGDELTELASGVSTRAKDANGYLMHAQCILLHGPIVKVFPDRRCRPPGSQRRFRAPTARASTGVSSRPRPSLCLTPHVTKRSRQQTIRELIANKVVGSQEDLRVLLHEAGWDVTQSTLSRDLRELRIARLPTPEGPRYVTPETLGADNGDRTLVEEVLPQFFSSVDGVGELLVLKTIYGGAQPVAEAIDDAGWDEVIGTIGGENTILIVCRSSNARETVANRLRRIADA